MTTRSAMGRRWPVVVLAPALALIPTIASAQLDRRASILQAEDRRARTPQDLATLRAGTRSDDPESARIAYRALGRLERPFLVPDILPGLRHPLPDVRAEAANALAQAAQGLKEGMPAPGALAAAESALIARLAVEAEPDVRAALCESIARLPYAAPADVSRAESTLLDFATRAVTSTDRLGLAKGLEALARIQRTVSPPTQATFDELRSLARHTPGSPEQLLLHEARVRRLALESLITIDEADAATVLSAAVDPDAQVRRLAVRAATAEGTGAVVTRALADPAPMVRIEALRASRTRNVADACGAALAATSDPDMSVAIVAIDQLGTCGSDEDALTYLAHAVADPADAEAPRNWHRTAHALVALATAAPSRAASALVPYTTSQTWQLRAYAARTAGILGNRDLLRQLATDSDDNVVEAAVSTLGSAAGHDADDVYVAALGRSGLQVIRAAALALDHTPQPERAVPALALALQRLEQDTRAGADAVRTTLTQVLSSLGAPSRVSKAAAAPPHGPITAADLRRLAAPRARFTIRDVGVFDVALFTTQAPATVLAFAQLAESGYYDGLTFHRVVPDGVVEGGSPGASDFTGTAPAMRDEVGLWPHVRGAVGIATRGRDTGNGQILIDLVDNPRYDHTFTVFAQVLNGMDTIDRILEGDVIERVEILP